MTCNDHSHSLSCCKAKFLTIMTVAGFAILLLGIAFNPDRIWANLLLLFIYLVTLGVGGGAFIAIQYASNAGWAVAIRRVPEALTALLIPAAAGLLVVVLVHLPKYAWHHHGDDGPGTFWFKELWLSPKFFIIRTLVYLIGWIVFTRTLVKISRKQDHSGDPAMTRKNVRISAAFLVFFGLTICLASFDWIMALDPMWFSTMFGVYQFAGVFMAILAAIIVVSIILHNTGPLQGKLSEDHLHDLGKLLMAFSCFWMYIWFSQYMLIWYANIPEETVYFMPRFEGAWAPLMYCNLILNWGVPFLVLLPRPCKRSASVMMKVALVVLVGRWLDLYLMIFPSAVDSQTPLFGLWEIAAITAGIGLFCLLVFKAIGRASVVPVNDPYLHESLHHHV